MISFSTEMAFTIVLPAPVEGPALTGAAFDEGDPLLPLGCGGAPNIGNGPLPP